MVRYFAPKICQKMLCSFFTEPILAKTNLTLQSFFSTWCMSLTFRVSVYRLPFLEERNDAQRGKFFRVHCISKLREARKLDGWSSVEPFRGSLKRPLKIHEIYSFFFGKGHAIFGGILKQQFQDILPLLVFDFKWQLFF